MLVFFFLWLYITNKYDRMGLVSEGMNMHYGNENSKRFMGVVIVILFIGGFIKGMYKSNKKTEAVTTLNLTVEIQDDWSVVKYDKDTDKIILHDDEGTATIQLNEESTRKETTLSESIGDWEITGYQTSEKTYHLYLYLDGTKDVILDYESDQEESIEHLKTLIQGIKVNE